MGPLYEVTLSCKNYCCVGDFETPPGEHAIKLIQYETAVFCFCDIHKKVGRIQVCRFADMFFSVFL